MPTAQQELERLGGKYDLAPEDFMPAVESEPLPGGTAAQELARLGRKHGLLGEPNPSIIAQERFEPEPAAPVSTAVAPGFIREEPAGISARPGSAMQRTGEWVTEKAQTHRELLDEANEVIADFTGAVPKTHPQGLMVRGAARFLVESVGFFGGTIPEMIGGVMAAEPGERGKVAAETGEEFFQGARELAVKALVTADKLLRDHLERTPDPFDDAAYDLFIDVMSTPQKHGLPSLLDVILGRKLTKEEYDKMIEQVIDNPEEFVFGGLILAGGIKGAAKVGKVAGKAVGRVGAKLKEPLTRKRGIEKEAPAKEVEPATEQVMRTELTERTEAAKKLGAMLFSEKTIADMTRGELEYYTGRTKKPPTKEVPSAKEIARDRRGRDEVIPEGREEGRVGGAEPVEGRGEPVGRGERPVEEGKAEKVAAEKPEIIAKDLGIEFRGLQERPKRGTDGKIIKPVVMEHEYQFTDPITKSDLTVKDLSQVAGDLKVMRKEFAAAKKPKEVPVEKEAVPAPPEKVAKEAPKPELPKAEVELKPVEGEAIGFKKTEIARIRKAAGLEELPPPQRKAGERAIDEAKEAGFDVNALEISRAAIASKGTHVAVAEQAGIFSRGVDVVRELNESLKVHSDLIEKGDLGAAQAERGRTDVLRKDLDVLTEASDLAGTGFSRGMNFRKMMRNLEDNTPAGMVQRGRSFKGKQLTEKETGRLERSGQKYEVARKRLEETEAKLADSEAAREKLIAERIVVLERKKAKQVKKTKSEAEKIIFDRNEAKKGLEALGYRVNDVTGVTAEGAYFVSKIAVSYLREGALTLDALVKKVLADVPELTASDVYRSLANKEKRRQAKARNDVTERIARIRTESRLLVQLENAEKGIFDVSKKRQPQPVEIRELQKTLRRLRTEAYRSDIDAVKLERALHTINLLQDQLVHQYRTVRKRKPIESAELTTARDKIRDIRRDMRMEDELARLNEQYRTGEFEVKEKPTPKKLSPEHERSQIELERARKRNRDEIQKLAPMTKMRVAVEIGAAARTMKTIGELSGTLRQGFFLIMSRPEVFPEMFAKSLAPIFSEFKAEQVDFAIRSHPNHYLRERGKVEFTELGGKLTRREEMISSNALEKVPGLASVIRGSARHMTTFLNLMRAAVYDGYLELYPNMTLAEMRGFGDAVNICSGRGRLGSATAIGHWLGIPGFAPRFAVSRFQTPMLIFKHWKQPRIRKEMAKMYMRTAITNGSLLMMAHLAGFEVGLDPRSPDWGKIKIGTTRFDIWAGVQQPARLITRIGYAAFDRAGITGKDLTDWEKHLSPVELIGCFAGFKLAPLITIPEQLLTSKTAVKEPITPTETAIRSVVPLFLEDIYDAYRLEGKGMAIGVGIATGLGIGASTYERFRTRKSARRGIVRLKNAGIRDKSQDKIDDARVIYDEWNRLHPDEELIIYIPKKVE